ncbi:hypothetical protein VPH35_066724 [Triticum aestivum]|uniref:RNase H type-1 domain-containing protein n=1 Tax=Triticum turgidum subsp. durum TaxID=4567 RepID=A0A9R0W052_TRITD|nr:unnamed protein product [Triticum turgidum subsp. durum]
MRKPNGGVVFVAYCYVFNRNDALETELHALMQGMVLALQHSDDPIIEQSNSSKALSALTGDGLLRSAYGHLVAETKVFMEDREFIFLKIKRVQNRMTDRLASYSRTDSTTVVWLHKRPSCIEEFLRVDCNPIIMK